MNQARTAEPGQATPEPMEQARTEEQGAPSLPAQTHAQPPQAPHPAQAPYQPYPYPQPTYVTQPPVIPFSKPWHWIKTGLTAVSIICCVIVLALAITLTMYGSYSGLSYTFFWGSLTVLTVLWDIAELITVYGCGKRHGQAVRQGIHPGAHVGVDLIIWLSGVLGSFVAALLYTEIEYSREECESTSLSSSYRSYYCDSDEYDALRSNLYFSAVIVIIVFNSILTIAHFIIFVRACMETNQRNRLRRAVMMMYYGPPPGMVPYGTYPMAPQQGFAAPTQMSQGPVANEKAPAVRPQDNHSDLAGFYAPAVLPPAAHSSPPPRESVAGSSSR